MRLLITGGAGFIGSHFTRLIDNRYPDLDIVVLDKLTYAGRMENLSGLENRIMFIQGDICNKNDVMKAGVCDCIINFAAETHVDRSIQDGMAFITTDVIGTYNLLDYARKNDIERFIQISTDEVYGSTKNDSFRETDGLDPSSPYSASKAGAEMIVQSYHKTYGLPTIITRSSNNFGPNQFPEKLIPLMILHALHDRQLPVYGDGQNIRDWIYVEDNCSALDRILWKGRTGETYNIGAGNERTNLQIVERILEYLHKPKQLIHFVRDRPGHDFRYSLNTEKITALGWEPSCSFEEGLQRTIDWYVTNEWWWKSIGHQKNK